MSFVPKGNTNSVSGITGFNFKPVIRASNMSEAGTLSGIATAMIDDVVVPVEGATVSVFAGETLVTSAFTDETGGYTILGLEGGNYTVTAEAMDYGMLSVVEVPIVVANETTLDFELISN